MTFLVDTNVLSEPRKRAPDEGVMAWFSITPAQDIFTSVLVVGELRRGVERKRRRDPVAGNSLDLWLGHAQVGLGDRILPVTRDIADRWGRLSVPDPLPLVDGLLAATALVHGMTLVTRNAAQIERTGVHLLNPFDPPDSQ